MGKNETAGTHHPMTVVQSELLGNAAVRCKGPNLLQQLASQPSLRNVFDRKKPLLGEIMRYLPLGDLTRCRRVSSDFKTVVDTVVPAPILGTMFLRFFTDTNRGHRFRRRPSRTLLRPVCSQCNATATNGRKQCWRCGGASIAKDSQGMRRLFFGQLRKERTSELAEWLIAMVYPDLEVFHIENHTSSKDGRGKGCAWVYVTNSRDEERLLALNKRMYVDSTPEHREGVWFVRSDMIGILESVVAATAYKEGRPQVLPRQRLVCECPNGPKTTPSPTSPSAVENSNPDSKNSGDSTSGSENNSTGHTKTNSSNSATATAQHQNQTPPPRGQERLSPQHLQQQQAQFHTHRQLMPAECSGPMVFYQLQAPSMFAPPQGLSMGPFPPQAPPGFVPTHPFQYMYPVAVPQSGMMMPTPYMCATPGMMSGQQMRQGPSVCFQPHMVPQQNMVLSTNHAAWDAYIQYGGDRK